MAETKAKREQRMRIDALLKRIRSGDYDDRLADIQKAIEDRNKTRRKAVDKLVAEVYGEDYKVRLSGSNHVSQFSIKNEEPSEPQQDTLPFEDEHAHNGDFESRSPLIGGIR